MIRQDIISYGKGKYAVAAAFSLSAGGVCIYLCGGTAPHIGTTVLAEPRPSLSGSGYSCTSSVLNLSGHKDEFAAREMAECICRKIQLPVSVCAGIHIDEASTGELQILLDNTRKLSKILSVHLSAMREMTESEE